MSYAEFVEAVKSEVVEQLKNTCPRATGHLRTTIKGVNTSDGFMITMAEYWPHVEFGTKPHIIEAKNAPCLSFEWTPAIITDKSGKSREGHISKTERRGAKIPKSYAEEVCFKRVHHPGTQPQPFIRNVFYNQLNKIIKDKAEMYLGGIEPHISYTIG